MAMEDQLPDGAGAGVIVARLLNSDYCNLVVEKLRQFVKAPPWLSKNCAALLTAIVSDADRSGLMAVLHGYLDGLGCLPSLHLPETALCCYRYLVGLSASSLLLHRCNELYVCAGVSMSSPQSLVLQQQVAALVAAAPGAASFDKAAYFRSICGQLSAAIWSAMRSDDMVATCHIPPLPYPTLP